MKTAWRSEGRYFTGNYCALLRGFRFSVLGTSEQYEESSFKWRSWFCKVLWTKL